MKLDDIIEITTLTLGFISFIATIAIIAAPTWRVSSREDSAESVSYITFQEGLWVRCTSVGKGSVARDTYWQCDHYEDALIGVTSYLTAYRVMMIIALLACTTGVVVSILGMKCTKFVDPTTGAKRKITFVSGFCYIFAGIITLVTVSWYAAEVYRQKQSPYYHTQQVKYVLGASVIVGWMTAAIEIICGCIVILYTCLTTTPGDVDYDYYQRKTNTNSEKIKFTTNGNNGHLSSSQHRWHGTEKRFPDNEYI